MAKAKTENPKRVLFDIKDVCVQVGLSYRSVHKAVRDGRIQSVRCGGAVKIPAGELRRICEKGF